MRHATDQAMRSTLWSLLALTLGSSGLLALAGWLGGETAWTEAAPADRRLDYRPAAYAIQNATIVASPKSTISNGTVIVREGVIEAVGPADTITIPHDAEVIDGKALVIYPGFIDLFSTIGIDPAAQRSKTGSGRPIPFADFAFPRTPPDNRKEMTPEFQVAAALDLSDALAEARRRLGFTNLVIAPAGTIASGQSALVGTSGAPRREIILRSPVALHIALSRGFGGPGDSATNHIEDCGCGDEHAHEAEATMQIPEVPGQLPGPGPTPTPSPSPSPSTPATPSPSPLPSPGGRTRGSSQSSQNDASGGYPGSLMGVIAHLRQTMLDAEHHAELTKYAQTNGGAMPPFDPTLDALHSARTKRLSVWWEANTQDEIHRVLDLADEFGTDAVIVGGREAGKVVDRLKAKNVPVVLRLDFPEEPKVPSIEEYRKKPAEERNEPLKVLAHKLEEWKKRVATAKALSDAGVLVAFSTDGLAKTDTIHAQVRKMIGQGLGREQAIAAWTANAAEITGMSKRLGTIEPGKLGNLCVWSQPYGDEKAQLKYVFQDGMKFEIKSEGPDGGTSTKGMRRPNGGGGGAAPPREREGGSTANPSPSSAKPAREATTESSKEPVSKRESASEAEKPPGEGRASTTKRTDPPARETETTAEPRSPQRATAKTAEPLEGSRDLPASSPPREPRETAKSKAEDNPATKSSTPAQVLEPFTDVAAEFEDDRIPSLKTKGNVLIKDATILTVTNGTIPQGSILIRDGKIAAVNVDLKAPEGVTVIDAKGMVAMPGMIDTHSHMAIQGGVNEATLSIVPEVRVKDVVNSQDQTIHAALAGGVTAARLLHGSANTIGGQDAVIKLRYGRPARDLIVRDGPQGVKFALGENVTRRTGRFPNTRMGVEATIERALEEAKAYKALWQTHGGAQARGDSGPTPRRDLRLEALVGILDGSIKIHSHCYRSDEILMLMRLAERHGIRVQSLQHVLEGYKVAAEIAAHGASASTFSDWWAYKIEAFDAIPFNAALLTQAGVRVCIKSDSEELVRHLNLEAAKMVRYGGVTEAQALAMVTINPARELGLDQRIGSIEVGKDGDIALFNAHPLDAFSRCELSLIDGEVYFQRKGSDGKPLKLTARPGDHTAMPATLAANRRAEALPEILVNDKGIYAITGARLHPVSGEMIENGTLVLTDGKIAAIGGPDTAVPASAQTIDARGLDVWPGMIDAGTVVGLFEVGSLRETQDFSDSATNQPELRTSVALHPDSELIPVTRAAGVLTAYVQPDGGTISGQGCVIDLEGWVPPEMVQLDKAGLNINLPRIPNLSPEVLARFTTPGSDPQKRRKEVLESIKEQFQRALAYDKVVTESRTKRLAAPVPDPRLTALAPYAKGEKPVIFTANSRGQILDALSLSKELKLKAVVSGGLEAWKVAKELKAANVPVLISGTLRLPGEEHDPADSAYSNPARLSEAGVKFAIKSGGSGPDQATSGRNLPFEAATAAAFGLNEEDAVRAVTLWPAQILGIEAQLGSLEVGKRANLVITAGHLLQPTTEVKSLFIGGKPVSTESKHTRLYEKYRRRLAEVKAGKAPLGLDRGSRTAEAPATNLRTEPASRSEAPATSGARQ